MPTDTLAIPGLAWHESGSIEAYPEAATAYERMLESIGEAKRSIYIANFCTVRGRIFDRFYEVLMKKAAEGVEIKLLADAYGSRYLDSTRIQSLRDQGVSFAWFRPWSWLAPWTYNHRLHKKLIIIDGETGFTGGVGIADFWIRPWERYPRAWRDSHFRLTGPVIGDMMQSFAQSWSQFSAEKLAVQESGEYKPSELPAKAPLMAAVNSHPAGGLTPVGRLYLQMIKAVRKNLDITTAYFGPSRPIRQALQEAAKRGVRVRLLVNGPYTSHEIARESGRHQYGRMLKAGVEIWEYQPTKIHAKLVTIDGKVASIGSGNLNFRTLYHDEEFNIVTRDPGLVRQLDRQFELDIRNAGKITPATWKSRPAKQKLLQAFYSLFRYVF